MFSVPEWNPYMVRMMNIMRDENSYDPIARMNQLYQPQTRATDAYNQLMTQYPGFEAPSGLRRLGAALAGLGAGYQNPQAGIDVARQINLEPTMLRRQEWNEKLKAIEPGMQAERFYNTNARQLASNTIQQEIADRRLDIQDRYNRARVDIANETNRIRDARLQVYAMKQAQPDLKLIFQRGGNIQTFNSTTGEIQDTGIPSGYLSDTDRITLQGYNSIEAARVRGEEGRKTQEERPNWVGYTAPDGTPYRVDLNNPTRMERINLPPGSQKTGTVDNTNPTLKPSEQLKEYAAIAQEIKNRNPHWSKWINVNPSTGELTITQPGWQWGRPTEEEHRLINEAIYGKPQGGNNQPRGNNGRGTTNNGRGTTNNQSPPQVGGGRGGGSGRNVPQNQPPNQNQRPRVPSQPPPPGHVYMMWNNVIRIVPNNQVERAKSLGAEVVR